MNFFRQYVKIISYVLLGLVFGFSCFYLLTNCYHYLEIRKDYVVDVNNQALVQSIDNKMNNVKNNISVFNANTYRGNVSNSQMLLIYQNLNSCVNYFNNDTFSTIKNSDSVSITDVYRLRESYDNDILSGCIVTNLYWTMSVNSDNINSPYLIANKEMFKLYINSLLKETSYLKKDLLNNSSYYFNTSIASASIKDNTKDGFYEVMGAYNRAADFVELISNWFKNEVEGNYD